ncbi:MbeD/MobD family mobilization/exclusion protein, partial [Salmonella enterica]
MTELEGPLLDVLEHLQRDYTRRLYEWARSFAAYEKMHVG